MWRWLAENNNKHSTSLCSRHQSRVSRPSSQSALNSVLSSVPTATPKCPESDRGPASVPIISKVHLGSAEEFAAEPVLWKNEYQTGYALYDDSPLLPWSFATLAALISAFLVLGTLWMVLSRPSKAKAAAADASASTPASTNGTRPLFKPSIHAALNLLYFYESLFLKIVINQFDY